MGSKLRQMTVMAGSKYTETKGLKVDRWWSREWSECSGIKIWEGKKEDR